MFDQPLGGPPHIAAELRIGADTGNAQQLGQIVLELLTMFVNTLQYLLQSRIGKDRGGHGVLAEARCLLGQANDVQSQGNRQKLSQLATVNRGVSSPPGGTI